MDVLLRGAPASVLFVSLSYEILFEIVSLRGRLNYYNERKRTDVYHET